MSEGYFCQEMPTFCLAGELSKEDANNRDVTIETMRISLEFFFYFTIGFIFESRHLSDWGNKAKRLGRDNCVSIAKLD